MSKNSPVAARTAAAASPVFASDAVALPLESAEPAGHVLLDSTLLADSDGSGLADVPELLDAPELLDVLATADVVVVDPVPPGEHAVARTSTAATPAARRRGE
ncbi:hypothetical protein ACQEVF_45615 [Nonomuraea polychroma]|uniref:hypothetical protein n=1 Tax=Nonomuraea polychroma TaxID=46176 RepID=UPI003D89D883